jgi:hypothetical protein
MRLPSFAVVVLALTGCSQGYIQLPPFPDAGPQDATTADVIVGEAGEGEGGTADGGDGATDAPSDAATDAPTDAGDAGDATGDATTDAEGD